MLKIIVVSITHRTLNNIAPVLRELIGSSTRCAVIWAPTSQRVAELGPWSFGLDVALDASGLDVRDPQALESFNQSCKELLWRDPPDLVISDDMTTWPNRTVWSLVRQMPARPWHLAWQHGFHQPWYELRSRFEADFFLCYGRAHAFLMGDALAPRVLPVGLPKLDVLRGLPTSLDGYLSWFAQPLPEAATQVRLLAEIAQATRLPVRIRPHPAAPLAFSAFDDLQARGLSVDDPASDPIDTLQHCNGFISTHSSATFEALLLDKTAVVFPSFGLTSFPGYPNVASDLTARAYLVAIQRIASRRPATEAFLVDQIGGRRFDHTARALRAIDALALLRAQGADPDARSWRRERTRLDDALREA